MTVEHGSTLGQYVQNGKPVLDTMSRDSFAACETIRRMGRPPERTPTPVDLRLREICEIRGIESIEELGKKVGIPAATLRKWGQRDSVSKPGAALIGGRLKLSPSWVLTGEGSPEGAEVGQYQTPKAVVHHLAEEAPSYRASPSRAEIVEVDVRGGLGGGGEAVAVAVTDEFGNGISADDAKAVWELPTDYVRHELRVSPAATRIIEVRGDSMSPTLESGDRVMVDTADKVPSPGGVFAIWDGLGVVVKRLEHIPNSEPPTLRLISDNQRHSMYERALDEVNVIGRVVWFARHL